MKRILLLTGNELRHEFFRKYISSSKEFEVVKTFCESTDTSLQKVVSLDTDNTLRRKHLEMRRQSEVDFFQLCCEAVKDRSNPEMIPYGAINAQENVDEIFKLNPDLIICYGSSIIKPPLIQHFQGKFINLHLGLSPFYRGAGTNYWPFVNNEPEYAGVTFMHIDDGIDTGSIIHQIQADIFHGDTIHQIGNRLIIKMAKLCRRLIIHFNELEPPVVKRNAGTEKTYRKKDFTEGSMKVMYQNFRNSMIEKYLEEVSCGGRQIPIVKNAGLTENLVNA